MNLLLKPVFLGLQQQHKKIDSSNMLSSCTCIKLDKRHVQKMLIFNAHINVMHQGGEEGQPRGILTKKILCQIPDPGEKCMSESPGCRAGFSTIFNVRDLKDGWVGTKVGVRNSNLESLPQGDFSGQISKGRPSSPLGHHIDR